MKKLAPALLALGLAASLTAQAKGKHRGLLIGGGNLAHGVSWMLQLDAANRPTTLRTRHNTPSAPWTTWGNVFGMTMDADNRTVIVPGIVGTVLNPMVYALVRYDPQAKAVVGTLWQGAATSLTIRSWSNLTLDSDGDVITIDNSYLPDKLATYDVFARTWRLTPLPALMQWPGIGIGAGVGGCEWDEFLGGINHVTWFGSNVVPGYLFHTSYDGLVTRTLVPVPSPGFMGIQVRFGGTVLDSGDWVSSVHAAGRPTGTYSFYLLASPGGPGMAMVYVGTGLVPWDVTHEKYAAPGRGFWVANGWPREARYVDVDANTLAVLHTGTTTTWPNQNAFEILPLYDRDLGSRRTGKATWDLYINPGAGAHAGQAYVVLASLASPRPGVTLPDGREIHIGLDALAVATSRGPFPPFITGNLGVLDRQGMGTVRIDMSALGTRANGTVIHFSGLVLDPAAPSGIAWVCDPHAFVIDVLP